MTVPQLLRVPFSTSQKADLLADFVQPKIVHPNLPFSYGLTHPLIP